MIKVVLIGGGNVAQHLAKALLQASAIKVVQIYNRTLKAIAQFESQTAITNKLEAIHTNADVYLISVSDYAIASISKQLPKNKALVVHTAGTMPMDVLETTNRKGVFYPLQTFSKERDVNFKEIPICIEAENENDLNLLENLALALSPKVHILNSAQRKQLHIAAVFSCNFVNHLYHLGHDVCNKHNIPFSILKPLIAETAAKINNLTPKAAQTGPAKRKDTETINQHLALLTGNQKEVYALLTKSILATYGKKL